MSSALFLFLIWGHQDNYIIQKIIISHRHIVKQHPHTEHSLWPMTYDQAPIDTSMSSVFRHTVSFCILTCSSLLYTSPSHITTFSSNIIGWTRQTLDRHLLKSFTAHVTRCHQGVPTHSVTSDSLSPSEHRRTHLLHNNCTAVIVPTEYPGNCILRTFSTVFTFLKSYHILGNWFAFENIKSYKLSQKMLNYICCSHWWLQTCLTAHL